MPKKVAIIILSVALVLIIAGGVAAALNAVKPQAAKKSATATTTVTTNTSKPIPPNPSYKWSADLSVDLGACKVITTDAITMALTPVLGATAVAALNGPDNFGYGKQDNGDKTQTCAYPLTTSSADPANGLNTDGVSVSVTQFASSDTRQAALSGYGTLQAVSGVGTAAFYANASNSTQDRYTLYVFGSTYLYEYDILQLPSNDSFNDTTALTALQSLASTATY